MNTHDIGRFFWARVNLVTDAPRYHVAAMYMTYEPYRGSRTVYLRLHKEFGIAFGWWENNPNPVEDELITLSRALSGRTIKYDPDMGEQGHRVTNLYTELV